MRRRRLEAAVGLLVMALVGVPVWRSLSAPSPPHQPSSSFSDQIRAFIQQVARFGPADSGSGARHQIVLDGELIATTLIRVDVAPLAEVPDGVLNQRMFNGEQSMRAALGSATSPFAAAFDLVFRQAEKGERREGLAALLEDSAASIVLAGQFVTHPPPVITTGSWALMDPTRPVIELRQGPPPARKAGQLWLGQPIRCLTLYRRSNLDR